MTSDGNYRAAHRKDPGPIRTDRTEPEPDELFREAILKDPLVWGVWGLFVIVGIIIGLAVGS
jgi:hypothetical protein